MLIIVHYLLVTGTKSNCGYLCEARWNTPVNETRIGQRLEEMSPVFLEKLIIGPCFCFGEKSQVNLSDYVQF